MPILKPSVQSLLIQMRFNGQALATGTGFVVRASAGPVLITNRHNVTGRNNLTNQTLSPTGGVPNEIVVVHNKLNALGEWIPKLEPLLNSDGGPIWYEHPKLGARVDVVALPLTELSDVDIFPYDLGSEDPPIRVGPADVVSVVGFPFGLQGGGSLAIWATGFVATEPDIDYNGLPVFLIDCRSRPGQSGSAVIASRSSGMVALEDGSSAVYGGPVSRFLGIYSGRINAQSDLGIVWKAKAVKELTESIAASWDWPSTQ